MLRLATSACPFCEAHAISRTLLTPWRQTRGVASFQKRGPARMDLSGRVAQGPKATTPDGKPVKKSRNSPFNGMNITTPPRDIQLKAAKHVSAAEEKRVMRHVKGGRGKPVKEKEPMKALKMQRALASVPYERRARTKIELAERDHFEEFDLLNEIKEAVPMQALGGLEDIAPTPIQRLAIPALLGTEDGRRRKKGKDAPAPPTKKEMQQFLLAAETGSGKTLAYVLPIVDALKRAEAFEAQQEAEAAEQEKQIQRSGQGFELPSPEVDDPHHTTGRPRVIILVPTQELVAQVGSLVKSLSHTVKFRAAMISANYSSTIIRNRLFSPQGIDVVVSTPHLLNSITESDPNVLSRVTHLVIDEADSLLDRSFSPLTSSIIDRATPSLQQLILCSATIPRSLDTYLHKRYPSIRRLTTPNLHAIPRRVQLTVVDIDKIPYQGNRDLTCAQVIWDLGKEADSDGRMSTTDKRILVFVNEREKADEVAGYLQSKGIDATALSRDTSDRNASATLAAFTGTSTSAQLERQQKEDSQPAADPAARRLRGVKVLVTTDIASRGIDTTAVKTVILYTVPHTSIDFIHRLGRVGRMGRRGRGIVLVGRGDRKDVVREVREGMFKGMALI
ncbi:hypothetical protein Q7P36_006660 [Cladosporium allicinum]